MNKFVKGSIAAAAGVVLLLGGAGSLAYWNSEASLEGGSVSTGHLKLTEAEKPAGWIKGLTQWVPGDTDVYRTTLTLDAEGDNIRGTVVLDPASIDDAITIVGQDGKPVSAAQDVLDQFDVTVAANASLQEEQGNGTIRFAAGAFTFDGDAEYTIPVDISVAFPNLSGINEGSQDVTIDFSKLAFIAEQDKPLN